jgi:CBS-domain-containing membrane protein
LGLRFLPVVNRHNQIVGTITRSDLTPDALAEKMIGKGAAKKDV